MATTPIENLKAATKAVADAGAALKAHHAAGAELHAEHAKAVGTLDAIVSAMGTDTEAGKALAELKAKAAAGDVEARARLESMVKKAIETFAK